MQCSNSQSVIRTEIARIVEESPLTVKAIAAFVGKKYATFKRELDPNDDGAKLGFDTAMDIMRVCNDYSPLQAMAAITEHHLSRVTNDTPLPNANDIDYLLMQSVMDLLTASRTEKYFHLQSHMDAVTGYMDMLFRIKRMEQESACHSPDSEDEEPNMLASSAVNLGEEGKELACMMFALNKMRRILEPKGGCDAA